ncbi:alpha-ketoglutarate-dependent dioxygenase alkB homolog 7, mitochondrial [Ambystoma mexicanum]|uniref:alpha-ketoglutarate-dependent dioxygenase alkB homolog 7, mitochondrial n=1 Tax=Ambystoma mexicanum TaxID=8296 RepID=UPI0037E88DBD
MAAPVVATSGVLCRALRAGFCRPHGARLLRQAARCLSPGTPAPRAPTGPPAPLPEGLRLLRGFLTPQEEQALLLEVEGALKRVRYEGGHWDQAIHGFREIEKSQWTEQNAKILQRVRDVAFPPGVPQLSLVHVLDLKADGYIKPHIDSVKFCGSTIAGLSLLSSSVMRLVSEQNKDDWADLLLERRSLYILGGRARYEFTHEILKDEDSVYNGERVPRERRISVICRNLPDKGTPYALGTPPENIDPASRL